MANGNPKLLDGTLLLPYGTCAAFSLKSWCRDPTEGTRRWELRRLFPAVNYHDRTHRTKVCNRVRAQRHLWDSLLENLGFVPGNCYGMSEHSVHCRNGDIEEPAASQMDREYWVTTQTMLALLIFWQQWRNKTDRAHTLEFAFQFLQLVLQDMQWEVSALPLPEESFQQRCAHERDAETGKCVCLEEAERVMNLVEKDGCDAVHIFRRLCAAYEYRRCAAVFRSIGILVKELAVRIEAAEALGSDDLVRHKSAVFRNARGKTCRMDRDVRLAVVSTELTKTGGTASAVAKTLKLGQTSETCRWMEEALADMQAACRLSNELPDQMSYALDGMTIGRPAKDYNLILQSRYPEAIHCMLPPQDWLALHPVGES